MQKIGFSVVHKCFVILKGCYRNQVLLYKFYWKDQNNQTALRGMENIQIQYHISVLRFLEKLHVNEHMTSMIKGKAVRVYMLWLPHSYRSIPYWTIAGFMSCPNPESCAEATLKGRPSCWMYPCLSLPLTAIQLWDWDMKRSGSDMSSFNSVNKAKLLSNRGHSLHKRSIWPVIFILV